MEYDWQGQGYNYWGTPDSIEESTPMPTCEMVCQHCGGDHFTFMCCNPQYLVPYSSEVNYQTTPQVQEDVTEGMPRLYSALEHWSKYGSFEFNAFAPG